MSKKSFTSSKFAKADSCTHIEIIIFSLSIHLILSFAKDKEFQKFFKRYEVPALCNLGTAFGMGLIVTTFMMALGSDFIVPALIGNVGAIVGSIISVRLMLHFTKKYYANQPQEESNEAEVIERLD